MLVSLPFPKPCQYLQLFGNKLCLYGTGKKETFQFFLRHYHWAVFTQKNPPEESCFPELPFSLTIPIGYFLVVINVQQNKSSWVLSVSDACFHSPPLLPVSTCMFYSCHLLVEIEHPIPMYVDKHVLLWRAEERMFLGFALLMEL